MKKEEALKQFSEQEKQIILKYEKLLLSGRPKQENGLKQQAEKLGISYHTLRRRIKKAGETGESYFYA